MYLFFDTETNGLPKKWSAPITDVDNWPRLIQLAYILYDENGKEVEKNSFYVKPKGFKLSKEAFKVNKITEEKLLEEGKKITYVLERFLEVLEKCQYVVGHNIGFDYSILGAEFLRVVDVNPLEEKTKICTMLTTIDYCEIPTSRGDFKWPKLPELYYKLFEETFEEAHDASVDIEKTAKCFWELIKREVI